MKIKLIGLLMAAAFFSGSAGATEYIHRDLQANTLDSPGCQVEAQAKEYATKPLTMERYTKKFCQSQGYGWHVEETKDEGKLVCTPCTGSDKGRTKCHVEDVVVTCKRIKPGSVGMLPGKS